MQERGWIFEIRERRAGFGLQRHPTSGFPIKCGFMNFSRRGPGGEALPPGHKYAKGRSRLKNTGAGLEF